MESELERVLPERSFLPGAATEHLHPGQAFYACLQYFEQSYPVLKKSYKGLYRLFCRFFSIRIKIPLVRQFTVNRQGVDR